MLMDVHMLPAVYISVILKLTPSERVTCAPPWLTILSDIWSIRSRR